MHVFTSDPINYDTYEDSVMSSNLEISESSLVNLLPSDEKNGQELMMNHLKMSVAA